MSDMLQNRQKMSIFLIPGKHLQIPVPGNQHQRRTFLPGMKRWCHVIYERKIHIQTTLLLDREMRHRLPADRIRLRDSVRINAIFRQPPLVKRQHQCQPAAGRMTADINLRRTAAILLNVIENPAHRKRRILQIPRTPHLRVKTVIYVNDSETPVAELLPETLAATLKTTAMKPDQSLEILYILGIVDVQFTPLLAIRIRLIDSSIRNILKILIIVFLLA